MQASGWRVDGNKFTNGSWVTGVLAHGANTRVQPSGVVDGNTFHNARVMAAGTNYMRVEGDYQDTLWSQPPAFGTGSGVYIESNTFTDGINAVDCNYGGQFVFRHNTVTNTYLEAHSVQGNNRACQRWEIYNNTFNSSTWVLMFIRGGSGYVFGNSNSGSTAQIAINNVRDTETRETAGRCDGSSAWDQNSAGQAGYACRDQIGRTHDTVKWTTGAAYAQPLTPAYFWNNTAGGPVSVFVHNPSSPSHIVAGRDYHIAASGTLGARPSTCSPGAGYWATDQGVLYACAAGNVWTTAYTPYVYPHPLTGSTPPPPPDTTAPSVPTGLTVVAVSSSQLNVSWNASTDNVGVTGYRVERCQGSGCTGFAQIAQVATTTYSDTGRTAGTFYRYRVRAVDAVGNLSGYVTSGSVQTGSVPCNQPQPNLPAAQACLNTANATIATLQSQLTNANALIAKYAAAVSAIRSAVSTLP
jgi:hypothetical protein